MEILVELKRQGIRIWLGEDGLKLSPKSKLTPELIEKIKTHKDQIINNLRNQEATRINEPQPQKPCYICGDYNWWLSIYGKWVCGTCHPPAAKELIKYAINKELKVLDEVLH